MTNFEKTKAELKAFDIKEADLDHLIQTLARQDRREAEKDLIQILFEKKEIREWLKARARKRRLKARALFLFDMAAHPDFPNAAVSREMSAVFSMCAFLCFEFLPRPTFEPFRPNRAEPPARSGDDADPLDFLETPTMH